MVDKAERLATILDERIQMLERRLAEALRYSSYHRELERVWFELKDLEALFQKELERGSNR